MALFESKDHFERRVKQFKHWTEGDDETLVSMIKEDKTLSEIAGKLGKTKFAVIMRTRFISGFENRITKGSKPYNLYDENASIQEVYTERMQKWSSIDNERLVTLYGQGENIYNLAHLFNRSPLGVLMHLQELYDTSFELDDLFNYARQFVGRKRIINPVQVKKAEEDVKSVEMDWKKYNEEQKALYPNHGKHWVKDDEKLLKLLFVDKECSIDILSAVFKRNPHAIQMKLVNMGLLEETESKESRSAWVQEYIEKKK